MVLGQIATNHSAAGGTRINGQGGADDFSAVRHDACAETMALIPAFGEAGAIVFHGEEKTASLAGQSNTDMARFGVTDGVGDGFLTDTIKVGGGGCVLDENGSFAGEGAFNAGSLGGGGSQIAKSVHEALGIHLDGLDAAGKIAPHNDAFLDKFDDMAGVGGFRHGLTGKFVA